MLLKGLSFFAFTSCALALFIFPEPIDIVLTNDDGWAVANIRATNDALKENGFNVVLSAPSENESGTASSTAPPTVLTQPCEFDTCPIGSPPEGFNASDPHLNYVNSYPVDSVRYGIKTLAPKFFYGRAPEFVVSGPNVGNNLGSVVLESGTVGAATEAAIEGIPSTAFSAATGSQVSYTTLDSDPTSSLTLASRIYADLNVKFTKALLASPLRPILPANISINVNYPATTNCASAKDFKFVLTRIYANATAQDVWTCGSDHLPDETTVVGSDGCFSSVSVLDAVTKGDVDAKTQAYVLDRLFGFFSCFHASS